MPMTLKADVARASRETGTSKPVDLVHLSSQTMGDRALEAEVLRMFLAQSVLYMEAWRAATGQEGRKHAAHTLKGAARGIGAWDLAELAAMAETPGFRDFTSLQAELDRVCAYIRTIA